MADSSPNPVRILVLCTGNSCRSQLAEAFLRRDGGNRVAVESAGTHPSVVNPRTIQVLAERGIDWSGARSKSMTEFLDRPFDVVVTVCDDAREACPVFPGGGRRIHRAFRDPALAGGTDAEQLDVYREVRDEIEAWTRDFLASEVPPPRQAAEGPGAAGGEPSSSG
jgi:arsenate reductase